MSDPKPPFDVYALWLMPCDDDAVRLQDVIDKLTSPSRQGWFVAHMTVEALPAHNDPQVIIDTIDQEDLFSVSGPLEIEVMGIGMRNMYTQALFFTVVPTTSLMALNYVVRTAFNRPDQSPYMPHISAAYGDFDAATKRKKAATISLPLPLTVTFDQVALWHAKGFPKDWKELHRWPLSS